MLLKFEYLKGGISTGSSTIECNKNYSTECFIKTLNSTNMITDICAKSFSRDKLEIINDFISMKNIISQINDTNYDKTIDVDFETGITTQKLFDAHEFFEEIGERVRSGELQEKNISEVLLLGSELNTLIHKMEGSISPNESHWWQAVFATPTIGKIPLNDEIISEHVLDYKSDHLYVGYGETGKNLHHTFLLHEPQITQRKMIQPQRYILSEVFMIFGDANLNFEKYVEWCEENEIASYGYDYMNPIYYGKWEIGRIVETTFGNNLSDFPEHDSVRAIVQ